MNAKPKKIVIVGGGTAGWMTANLMANCWKDIGIEIALVESPDIGIIGVGEGSTPQLKEFFDFLEISEAEWMPRCNATYKNGITFSNWSTKPGFHSYFHSFESEVDFKTEPAFFYNSEVRRKGVNVEAHPNLFYLGARLTAANRGPVANANFPFKVGYGYHFDASLLGAFLREKAKSAGVQHIEGTIHKVSISSEPDNRAGDIAGLHLESGEFICADFFVDCSGFNSLLLQKALQVPFKSYDDNLFNNAAVSIQTDTTKQLNPQTISTALGNGWVWRIPLTNRTGNGYVYSSDFCSAEDAERELREHLNVQNNDLPARHLKMKVGRVEKHWHRNCLAVGLSQGFIEPLEATALHIVQETIQGFIDAFELGSFSNVNQEKFNQRINARFEGVRDYIVTHYILNSRNDSQYWLENRQNTRISDSLEQLLECWSRGANLSDMVDKLGIDKYYRSMSWHSIFSGYGFFPDANKLMPGSAKAHKYKLDEIARFLDACSQNFPASEDLVKALNRA